MNKRSSGVTLVELMVTVAILSIGVLATIASFRFISISIQNSKSKTLANNLAQEQIEKLKNLSYYLLLVTTTTVSDNRFSPSLDYDAGNYPAAPIVEGGITYTRATRVDLAYQNGNTITTVAASSNDTGLKQITVYVIWSDANGLHYQEMHNLMSNPAANPLNATFSGTVRQSGTGTAVAGAYVQVVDNSNWYAITDNSGFYSFQVSQGSYTIMASSSGYFTATTNSYQTIDSGQAKTVDMYLMKMSSGSATGYVYLDNHLVISAVVASTGTNNDLEYLELYNPTTSAIFIGDSTHDGEAGHSMPSYVPVLWGRDNSHYNARHLHYISSTIRANGFYLIANTGNAIPATACGTIGVAGVTLTPDACWNRVPYNAGGGDHAIACGNACTGSGGSDANDSGGITLLLSGGVDSSFNLVSGWQSYIVDSMGWNQKNGGLGNAAPSNSVEGTALSPISNNGLPSNGQYVRMSRPGSLISGEGRAYDSDDNSTNFFAFATVTYTPYTSSNTYIPVAGSPATGAYVAFNDPISNVATCTDTTIAGTYRVCSFASTNIATGTWTMEVASGTYYVQVGTAIITAGTTSSLPNASTNPTWPSAGLNNTLLNDTTNCALISGVVTDANGIALSGIAVNAGGTTRNTSSSGRYLISATTGDIQVIANYNTQNKSYTYQSSSMTVYAAQLYDVPSGVGHTWFTLSQGGLLSGYFQTGSNTPIPNRVANALNGGNVMGTGVSGSDGHFYITNLATGSYTVQPALDTAEDASPDSIGVTLSAVGATTFSSTFTITSGLAQITGQTLSQSQPITTGVLVMASTGALSGGSTTPPPTMNGGTGMACSPCYYAASSDSTGRYTLNLRSSAVPYQVYGWYTTFNGKTPVVTRAGAYSVSVSSAGQIKSQDLSW